MKQVEEQLERTILELANSFEKEAQEHNRRLIKNLFKKYRENESLYELEIDLAYLNFRSFAAMPWLADHPQVKGKEKSVIEFIYSGMFPHFVRSVIEKNEGTPFSEDKISFVIRRVKEAIASGKNNSLYVTYEGCENIPESKWKEQAYWSPKSFKDTNEVMLRFWEWYNVTY